MNKDTVDRLISAHNALNTIPVSGRHNLAAMLGVMNELLDIAAQLGKKEEDHGNVHPEQQS